ncbi:hypothetical protein [Brachyspira murdochii]
MKTDLNKLYDDNLNEFNEIEKIINKDGISLFGAGEFGYRCAKYLMDNNYKINCFIDNDINKQNKEIYGIKIVPKNDILSKNSKVVLISTTKYINEIINENKDNYTYIIPFDKYFIMKNFNRFISIYEYLYDNKSKEIFEKLLYCK